MQLAKIGEIATKGARLDDADGVKVQTDGYGAHEVRKGTRCHDGECIVTDVWGFKKVNQYETKIIFVSLVMDERRLKRVNDGLKVAQI